MVGSHPKGFGAPAVPVPEGFFGAGAVPAVLLDAVLDGFGFAPAGSVELAGALEVFPTAFGAGQPGRSAGVVALGGVGFPEAALAFGAPDVLVTLAEALVMLTEDFLALAEAFVTLAPVFAALGFVEDTIEVVL